MRNKTTLKATIRDFVNNNDIECSVKDLYDLIDLDSIFSNDLEKFMWNDDVHELLNGYDLETILSLDLTNFNKHKDVHCLDSLNNTLTSFTTKEVTRFLLDNKNEILATVIEHWNDICSEVLIRIETENDYYDYNEILMKNLDYLYKTCKRYTNIINNY